MTITAAQGQQPRHVGRLREVGAITSTEAGLLRRAAELTGGSEVVGVDGLAALRRPEISALLFDRELRALKRLDKHLSWEELPDAPAEIKLPPLKATDVSEVQQSPFAERTAEISTLGKKYEATAQRVQRLSNSDREPNTISLTDLENVEDHAGWTAGEKEQIKEMQVYLRKTIPQEPANMKAIAEVPEPGRSAYAIAYDGQLPFLLTSDVSIREYIARPEEPQVTRSLVLQRKMGVEVQVPDGHKLLLMPHDRSRADKDLVVGAGKRQLFLNRGPHRVQLWKHSKLVETHDINIPSQGTQSEDISQFLDHALKSRDGPLPRVLVGSIGDFRAGDHWSAMQSYAFAYSFEAKPAKGGLGQWGDQRRFDLPAGRYTLAPDTTLEVFDTGALRVCRGDDKVNAPWTGNDALVKVGDSSFKFQKSGDYVQWLTDPVQGKRKRLTDEARVI